MEYSTDLKPSDLDFNSPYEQELLENTSVMLATPCYGGQVYSDFMISLLGVIKVLDQFNIKYNVRLISGESLITRARNHLVSYFMSTKCTHLMFIDADIVFPKESIAKLIAGNKGIACGVYPIKKQPAAGCKRYVINVPDKGLVSNVSDGHKMFSVNDVGTGFMLIKRDVIEIMKKEYPNLKYTTDYDRGFLKVMNFDTDKPQGIRENLYSLFDTMHNEDDENNYLSEDYAFCKRWKDIGGDIWVDPDIELNHIGRQTFLGNSEELRGLFK